MRILNVVCGICVLLISVHMVHAVHHFLGAAPDEFSGSVAYWGGLTAAVVIDAFAFAGGCLLIRRAR
ncbi:MAG TPA: hypothetical protein VH088_09680 [Terriglobales bacterium]|jgi:hypothetical protein|nr:hypothetical protein [Terriglobales bacterium]